MSKERSDSPDIKIEYFTRKFTYDCADYGHPPIPENARVSFYGEYTCFYGRYVKVGYGGRTYYLKPEDLFKRITRTEKLTEPVSGCYAKHVKHGTVGLTARVLTDSQSNETEYWLACDKDRNLWVIALSDCEQFYAVLGTEDDIVTYSG